MKFSIPQEVLARALRIAAKVAPQKPTLPILANVLFDVREDGAVFLESTNMEVSIQQRLSAKVEQPGKVALPAAFLADLMGRFDKGVIDVAMNDKLVTIFKLGKAEAPISGIDWEEWPQVPVIDNDPVVELSFVDLHRAIDQTVFCASTDSSRPAISGVLLRIADTLKLSAIDGFRFGIVELPIDNPVTPVDLIIPAAALQMLPNLFDDTDTISIRVSNNGNKVCFASANVALNSRLIDNQFPDISRYVPSTEAGTLSINRLALLSVAKTAAVFGTGESDWLQLTIEDQQLLCQTRQYETRSYSTRLPIEIIADMPNGVDTFRGQIGYFVQALQALTTDSVLLHMRGSRQLLMINESGNERGQWAIMPLTIK
jgi:DNA polymerase-3 subunit beta